MGIRIGSIVINCADIEAMTDFWTQALDLVPATRESGEHFRVLRGERVNLSLQHSDTPVSARDQMHLDLYSDEKEEQVQRMLDLGATKVRENNDPEDTYVVMRDPEGNEFCICV
ncbi:VOC family protein [Haloechinothrix sp. LS1_15]|uniref:VOC family protein n=1 Tax=Haloechinothrix sp. LS1_15 TaxID=2652248 RepID=UPI0029488D81|nr:VOC family protein [Haloechinothrix sp. LS1_15]MDV6012492.1 VOC family protein [Haloechinothrix sp. LS1_15]